MKKILFLFAVIFPALAYSQAIVKGSGIVYTNGAPTHTPNLNTDAEVAIDTTSGYWYERSRDGLGWLAAGFRIQKLAGSSAPVTAPADKQSEIVLNDVDSLYRWRSGAWYHLNKVVTYAAGTGINITVGNVIENTGDLSTSNEGTLGVGAGGSTSSVLTSNTSGAAGVTLNVAGILSISESTSSNGGSVTITGTEVDGSVSNELQTIANTSDATSHTVTLSNSGGTIQFVEGTNVTLTTTGTSGAGIVTIASSGGGADLSYSGASSPVTLASSSGTDVTFTQGGIVTITSSGSNMTISATEVDGSITNELQTITNTSDATSHTVTLSNSGGTVQLVEGANVTLTTSGTGSAGIVTIAATSGGGADLSYSGASSPVTLASSTGADVTFTQGGIVTITSSGSNMTISATEVDGSVTNEAWTIDGDDADTEVIGSQTVKFQGAGITTTDYNPTTDVLLITSTEVDGSITNELQTLANTSDATSHTVTLSNSGGSVQLIEGTNVTLTTGGTSGAGTVTIASTAGATDLSYSGASSPVTLTSSTGTDVTITQGGIVTITASGSNMTISATEVDGSTTNEAWTIDADDADTEVIGSQTVRFQGAGITTTDYNPATDVLLITSTEVDGSVSNELQTIANTSDATSHTVTLSNSGGTIQFVEGANVTLTTSGTGSAGIVTIAATSGGGADLSYSGASSPVTLASSTGADVTFTQGGIVTITSSGSNMTISATEVDGSITNELQTIANTSDATSHTVTLSNSGGTIQFVEGANVTLTTTGTSGAGIVTIAATSGGGSDLSYSGASSPVTLASSSGTDVTFTQGGIVTITSSGSNMTISATEVDGSVTNELQTITNTADATSHTVTLSNSGGSVQLVEGANVTLTTTGTSGAGVVTIASTEVDGSVTNEAWTIDGDDADTEVISNQTVKFQGAGITTTDYNPATDVLLITSTEVDGSVTNEAWTIDGDDADTEVISNQTVKFQGAGITATDYNPTTDVLLITSTEVDGSITNELQTIANTSDATSHTVTLSNSGGTIQFVEGTNVTLTTSGTGSAGIVTIAASGGAADLSYSGASSPVTLASSTGTDVTFTQGGIVTITASGSNMTISATEVDGSVTNELQTIANSSDATSHTVTLSNSGGSVQLIEGTNVTLTTGGTSGAGTVTIAASGGAADLSYSGASSPVTLAISTGTDVTFTQGGIVTITSSGANMTISATEVDGSVTNEAWTIDGDDADTEVISNQTVKFQGAGITTTDYNPATDVLLITSTEVDGSVTNELQTIANSSDATSHTVTLSNSGGSVQLVEGTNVTLTTSGTGSAGIVTIASTEVDGSVTNEAWTIDGDDVDTEVISNQTVKFQGAGITTTDYNPTTDVLLITSTEVDGSVSNELQTIANTSDATSHTVTLSNSGGTIQFVEGTNVTLTTTGTSGAGIVTIASTGGGADLSYSGVSSPVTLASSSGTDVTFTQGGIVTITSSGSNMTISATEVDGSVTNELQTIANTSDATSHTVTLSNSGGTIQFVEGTNVTLTTTGTSGAGVVTIASTEVDGSVTNELQTIANTSDATSHTVTLSNSGGTIQFVEGTNVTLTTSGTGSAGIVTIASTEVDGSVTNELQTIANTSDATSHTVTLSNSGGSFQLIEGTNVTLTTGGTSGAGTVTIAASGGAADLSYSGASSPVTLASSTGTDVTFTQGGIVTITSSGSNMTISATEVDGSVTNELQTIANTSDATSHTVTLSNSGGSVQLVEGSNITLTTTGTSGAGVVTISSAAGGGTDYAAVYGYIEGITGSSIDLDANDGNTKDKDGTNLVFDIPSNTNNFRVFKNGVELNETGTGTTRDYSVNTTTNVLTLTTSLTTSDRVIVRSITGSSPDIYSSAEITGAGTVASPLRLAQQSATSGQVLAWNGTQYAPTSVSVSPSVISPSQITGDQDNYNPTGFDGASYVRLNSDDFRAITSFASQTDGEEKTLVNTGSFPIYFPGEHPDGTAANRIITPYDYLLHPGKAVKIVYDNTSARWFIVGQKERSRNAIFYETSFGSVTSGDWATLAFTTSGTAAATTGANATSTLPGRFSLGTGSTSTGFQSIAFSKTITTPVYFGACHIAADATVSLATLSDGTETFTAGIAVTNLPTSTTFAPNNTIGIRYTHSVNSGKWLAYSKDNAGAETTVDLGITVAVGTPYRLRIEVDKQKTEARFYVNGVMSGRITANLPTGAAAGFRTTILKSAGTTSRSFNAHYMSLEGIY
jgi:uncharacterized protein YodC (DUF2158 family)